MAQSRDFLRSEENLADVEEDETRQEYEDRASEQDAADSIGFLGFALDESRRRSETPR